MPGEGGLSLDSLQKLDIFQFRFYSGVMLDRKELHRQLREAGLRVTAPRVAVLEILDEHPHSTADFVAAGVRENLGGVSTQTVYDVLRSCTERGLLRRIEPAGSAVRYETRTDDNHHHLICRTCGEIVDIDCVDGRSPCLTPDRDHGYRVDEAEVIFWGECAACQQVSAGGDPR
ncbi:ferric-uptake regulator [Gordonia bronchialis DSM 43247]|uniref:Ferric-uptake regulator n=2 Tax=Gordonia bronchialis TaxID=2054 RepID=D0LDI1_GORB4|nr:ferric-uptake regulator [Gordonia bronchialis DSM 43247]STQ62573.1 Peroxide operon regulator [Gordonia bronchialis]